MPFRRPSRRELAAVRARREHSEWLTEALYSYHIEAPRIPAKRFDPAGGFHGYSAITRTPSGRAWADAWWRRAFQVVSLGEPGGRLRFLRRF